MDQTLSYSDPAPSAPIPDLVDIDAGILNNNNNNNNINIFLSPTTSTFPVVWPSTTSAPSFSSSSQTPFDGDSVPSGRTLSHAIS